MASKEVVVVGSCMMDFVSYASRLPTAGETIHGKEFVTNFGGKGANQCVATARLGGKTTFVARVGNDDWGEKYIANLKKENVNTDYVWLTENSHTGIAQIIVSETGENQIVIVAGANNKLDENDIEKAKNEISSAAAVVLQLETSVDVAVKTLKLCKGISILNGAPAVSQSDPQLFSLPSIFCVNETEASIFTGLPVNNVKEAEDAATNLLSKGCKSVLITLGAQGAIFVDDKEKKFYRISSPQVKSVDSTGAGDAFVGALAFLLANRQDLHISKSIEIACAVAADSVTRPGTQKSFPGPIILKHLLN